MLLAGRRVLIGPRPPYPEREARLSNVCVRMWFVPREGD